MIRSGPTDGFWARQSKTSNWLFFSVVPIYDTGVSLMTAKTSKRTAYRSIRGGEILENQGITIRPLGIAVTLSGSFIFLGTLCARVTDIPDFSLSAREVLLFAGEDCRST